MTVCVIPFFCFLLEVPNKPAFRLITFTICY